VNERLLTLTETADLLGVSVATVKRRVRAGAVPVFRDGKIVRVRECDLRRYVTGRIETRRAPALLAIGVDLHPGERLWH
jgi:excisionase family DNA binding protein